MRFIVRLGFFHFSDFLAVFDMINPSHEAFPDESNLIGRMVIGYSELDIALCFIGGLALGQKWAVLDALHAIENEGTRLDVISRLVRHIMVAKGHEAKFAEAIGAIRYCKGVATNTPTLNGSTCPNNSCLRALKISLGSQMEDLLEDYQSNPSESAGGLFRIHAKMSDVA